MKEFVMWLMLICLLVGIPMFLIGRFIEKTVELLEAVEKGKTHPSWGSGYSGMVLAFFRWECCSCFLCFLSFEAGFPVTAQSWFG